MVFGTEYDIFRKYLQKIRQKPRFGVVVADDLLNEGFGTFDIKAVELERIEYQLVLTEAVFIGLIDCKLLVLQFNQQKIPYGIRAVFV